MKKVLIDIGHPAHIHYFKYCAQILSRKGYDFLFTVRERDSTMALIQSTGFNYVSRGKGGRSIIDKAIDIRKITNFISSISKQYKPDMFLSMASPYLCRVARRMDLPYIALDDTEHAKLEHLLSYPYSSVILSPSCFYGNLDKKQILFDAYLELLYLHPNYYTPNPVVIDELGLKPEEKYCIVRFVSWDANHDVGQHGLSLDDRIKIVEELSKTSRVFISSEQQLPDRLMKYKFNLHPSKLHDALNYASLYIGEGSTTASESAVLGTPAIYVNTLSLGYCNDEAKYGLLYKEMDAERILNLAKTILSDDNSNHLYQERRHKLLSDKIDPTAFLCWFIENYPESEKIMRSNPDYQYRFR